MEKNMLKTPPQAPHDQPSPTTPPPPSNELRKPLGATPDRLRLPKAFKYPERYTSPTDSLMSPVTKGLLARGKKAAAAAPLPPPGKNQHKIPESCLQDAGPLQNKVPMLIDEKLE